MNPPNNPPKPDPITFRALWRSLVPAETGGWFMSLLPLAAGWASAPSGPGAALAAVGFLAFLMRIPLRQLHAGVRPRVSRLILWTAGLLGGGLAALVAGRRGAWGLLPLLPALPLGLFALWADLRRKARELLVELSALGFFCVFSGAIAAGGGLAHAQALRVALLAFLSLAPGFGAVRFHLQGGKTGLPSEIRRRRAAMHLLMSGCLLAGLGLVWTGWAGPWWWLLQGALYSRAFLPLHRGPAWHLGVLEIVADAASLSLVVLKL